MNEIDEKVRALVMPPKVEVNKETGEVTLPPVLA